MGGKRGTIFIVDDDAAVREYLQWLLESSGFRVRLFEDAHAFLSSYDPEQPGCLLLDIRMPGMSGLDLQQALMERGSWMPIIMMTGYADIPMAVQAMRNGAMDFIEKPFSDQVLLNRINEALALDEKHRAERAEHEEVAERLARLTPRQHEVLQRLMAGKPSKVIAAELGLSPKTVDVHRFRIMRTMRAGSLPDLFRLVSNTRAARE